MQLTGKEVFKDLVAVQEKVIRSVCNAECDSLDEQLDFLNILLRLETALKHDRVVSCIVVFMESIMAEMVNDEWGMEVL